MNLLVHQELGSNRQIVSQSSRNMKLVLFRYDTVFTVGLSVNQA